MGDRMTTYVKEFERWTAGSAEERARLRAELEAHLSEADEAGQLDRAIARLGPPRDAARVFTEGRMRRPAPRTRRLAAALVDYASLILPAAVALGIAAAAGGCSFVELPGGGKIGVWVRDECTPETITSVLSLTILIGGFFWFCIGLTLMEWRYGRTPGKALLGLRVVSEDGTAISLGQAVIRRLPLVFSGGLQIVDWAFALVGPTYQRGFDRIARTLVVREGR